MGKLHETVVSLRFFGDDLDPEEITLLLGVEPTFAVRKGGVWRNPSGAGATALQGQWRIRAERRSPGDLEAQIAELLAPLTPDTATWKDLTRRYRSDIFCGLFMNEYNEGVSLPPEILTAVGSRGLTLALNIYARNDHRETTD